MVENPAFAEEDLILVSALQHYVYCPRQCALIHVEHVWDENIFTLRGRRIHERADTPRHVVDESRTVEYALPIWSDRLGLIGKADVVEFLSDGTPYPVEYKAGPRTGKKADEVQLCAQALCLEEMFGLPVPKGALYYHGSRRRREVVFTPSLKDEVHRVTSAIRSMIRQRHMPPPVADQRCRHCSLLDACMPAAIHSLNTNRSQYWLGEDEP